jgi:hypothetical protein
VHKLHSTYYTLALGRIIDRRHTPTGTRTSTPTYECYTLRGPRSIYMLPSIPFHCWEEVGGCRGGREVLLVERMLLLLPSQKYCRCRVVGGGWRRTLITPPAAFICIALHCIARLLRLVLLFSSFFIHPDQHSRRFCLN